MYSSQSYLYPSATSSQHTGPKGATPVIGLDFGTSTAAIAAVVRHEGQDPTTINFHDLIPIDNWAYDPLGNRSMSVRTMIYFPPDRPPSQAIYGYEVTDYLRRGERAILSNEKRVFDNIKMMLNPNSGDTIINNRLQSNFRALQGTGYVGTNESLIVKYLVFLLTHTKNRLRDRIDPTMKPEVAIAMPSDWGIKADRVMCSCLSSAVREVWPIYGVDEAVNVFTVSEPDAQSTYTLGSTGSWRNHDIKVTAGQVILIGDAGGGTFEADCYQMINHQPCRFRELCKATADTCGSALLDEDFRTLISKKTMDLVLNIFLRDLFAWYAPGTLQRLVEEFESLVKRRIDLCNPDAREITFEILIQRSKDSGFNPYNLTIGASDWQAIFEPRMHQIVAVLQKQYDQCRSQGINIDTIIMSGEYSQNAEVRRAINWWIDGLWPGVKPQLAFTNDRTAAAVAIGALFRALDRSNGPGRFLRAGFGIVRGIPAPDEDADERDYPKDHPEFKYFCSENDIQLEKGKDGLWYSFGTIDWVLPKNTPLPPSARFGPFSSKHVFDSVNRDWVFKESLYTNAKVLESGWPFDHKNNAEAEWYCDLRVDVDFLKKYSRKFLVNDHFEINLDLYFTVGTEFHHQLTFEVSCDRYGLPAGLIKEKQQVMLQPFFEPSTD